MNTDKPPLEDLLDTKFKSMIKNMAHKQYIKYAQSPGLSIEDVINEGMLAVTTAYQRYSADGGAEFKTYAYPYVKHAIRNYCNKYCSPLSISEKEARYNLPTLLDIGIFRIDQTSSNEDDAFDIPVGSGIQTDIDIEDYYFRGLDTLERKIATDYFIHGYSLQEVSTNHHISKSLAGVMVRDLKFRIQSRIESNDSDSEN